MLSKKPKSAARKRAVIILVALLAVNGGVANILINQITDLTHAKRIALVKDAEVSAQDADSVVNDGVAIEDESTEKPSISTYTVKEGDTISGIAEKHHVSVNTIRWANDLTSKSTIKPGDELVVLPVSGVEYTVKKGDTLSGIAKKFDVDQEDILNYNDVTPSSIGIGDELVIPNAEPLSTPAPKKEPVKKVTTPTTSTKSVSSKVSVSTNSSDDKDEEDNDKPSKSSAKFIAPISGGVLTQGIHDGNAVDFGVAVGTTVKATAAGTVIIAKSSGYNGGYGEYVVITHDNGSQTLYGHLSQVNVSVGDHVSQGEKIGESGNTGRSTGPHLHYKEIGTGTRNTFSKYKTGTDF